MNERCLRQPLAERARKWMKMIKSGERSLIRKIYDQINNQIEDKINTKTRVWRIKKLLNKLQLSDLLDE